MDVAALAPSLPAASADQQRRMRDTAESFEASFLSSMLAPMFEGLKTDGPFGGGHAEQTYRSFMLDAFAKQTTRAGGIGLADTVYSELLKMQGLSDPAEAPAPALPTGAA